MAKYYTIVKVLSNSCASSTVNTRLKSLYFRKGQGGQIGAVDIVETGSFWIPTATDHA